MNTTKTLWPACVKRLVASAVAPLSAFALASTGLAQSPVDTAEGVYTSYRFKENNALKETVKGEFEIRQSEGMFQIRILHNADGATHKLMATSDYKTLYYSQTFEGANVKNEGPIRAWGIFDNGFMPNKLLQWTNPQTLALSFLQASGAPNVVRDGALTSAAIPGFVLRRRAEINDKVPSTLHTRVVTQADAHVTQFWLVRNGAAFSPTGGPPDQVILASIETRADGHGMPKSVTLEHFHVLNSPKGFDGTEIAMRNVFEITSRGLKPDDTFKRAAYDAEKEAVVNDNRFPSPSGYVLKPWDEPPFARESSRYIAVKAEGEKRAQEQSQAATKSRVVTAICFLSIIPLWIAMRRHIFVGHKQQTT
jgi:hypothetical protein